MCPKVTQPGNATLQERARHGSTAKNSRRSPKSCEERLDKLESRVKSLEHYAKSMHETLLHLLETNNSLEWLDRSIERLEALKKK